MQSEAIRQSFLDFFKAKSHQIVASASLMPTAPNLLFTNAGMNPFVPYFLNETPAPYSRIANAQKCIRAGGKHNDLDDVGFDTYHHTFFEMLGNWSIGDYFKKEAIEWSWELLTEVWGFPKERLYATVYKPEAGDPSEFDEEAYTCWEALFKKEGLDPQVHILYGNKKDNFWMMGETGPCGPCSELHIDLTPEGATQGSLVNKDSPWCIEIWNLVFIQLNATPNGEFTPLPQCHVDTGMGFERIAGILATTEQFTDFTKAPSNYNSDLFTPIFKAIEGLCDQQYQYTMPEGRIFKNDTEVTDCAFRVIADHIRTLCFSIADGIIPGNEGRNYVLRRILRRAILFGQKLNLPSGFFTKLIPVVVKELGTAYPELKDQEKTLKKVIANEESAFNKTLERGLQLFDSMSAKGTITGEEAFTLYDTYGFPYDLTALIAEERSIPIDAEGFRKAMEQQKERARSAQKKEVVLAAEDSSYAQTNFLGFELPEDSEDFSARILALEPIDGNRCALILDKTQFYGEMGGQVGDTGSLSTEDGSVYSILDTQVKQGVHLHILEVDLKKSDALSGTVKLCLDRSRRVAIQRHHSATHLLNWALRNALGSHIQQAGSMVSENRLRFDFSHFEPIDEACLEQIEQNINACILGNHPVNSYELPFSEKPDDVVAVFGEKYGDRVRVVDIGGFSKELCGGTHVAATGEIGLFKIVSESGIAAGTRRIEAVCGASAYALTEKRFKQIQSLSSKLKCPSEALEERIDSLIENKKQIEKVLKGFQQKALSEQVESLIQTAGALKAEGGLNLNYVQASLDLSDSNDLRTVSNQVLAKLKPGLVILASASEGNEKNPICASLSSEAVEAGYNAGQIVQELCQQLGGRGGGKANFAMGGIPQNDALADVLKNYSPKKA
ncbi:MAG: alanine--tRNA ligase [Puniceicoccaceae bacterium]|nr:alanine--tRNA ligase [Puniceicoccaceae bacterium]